MVCCTSSWEMAWSHWMTWRRWTDSGESRGQRITVCPRIQSCLPPVSYIELTPLPHLLTQKKCLLKSIFPAPTIVLYVFERSDFTGSVLRVDVDTEICTSPYSIPRNNPYFNSTNQPPEIFAHGLHDPGRWVKVWRLRLMKVCFFFTYCRNHFCFSWIHPRPVGVQWIGIRSTTGASWFCVQTPVAETHQQGEYWRLLRGKITVSGNFLWHSPKKAANIYPCVLAWNSLCCAINEK